MEMATEQLAIVHEVERPALEWPRGTSQAAATHEFGAPAPAPFGKLQVGQTIQSAKALVVHILVVVECDPLVV
jgi:hypothetical protein